MLDSKLILCLGVPILCGSNWVQNIHEYWNPKDSHELFLVFLYFPILADRPIIRWVYSKNSGEGVNPNFEDSLNSDFISGSG